LNIGDQARLMAVINYPMRGEQVCQEIKDSVLSQLPEVEALKMELLELIALGVPELWKVDGAVVSEVEFLEEIKKLVKKNDDVDSFLTSFYEAHLLTLFDSWESGGFWLQQCFQKNNCISYKVLNTVALAQSSLKDIFGMHSDWGKVQRLLSLQN